MAGWQCVGRVGLATDRLMLALQHVLTGYRRMVEAYEKTAGHFES
jgi:hypothetical protein